MKTSLFHHANVLDVDHGTYTETDLRCHNGHITGPDDDPADGETIDLRGAYVLPGLIDAHVHVNAITANTTALRELHPSHIAIGTVPRMTAMLERGFTTVRDAGGADHGLVTAQGQGLFRGPRLIHGGKALSQTGGHGDKRGPGVQVYDHHAFCGGSSRIADGVDGVRLAAREELRRGAHHIKVMASGGVASPSDHIDACQYSLDELRAIVDEANMAGRYVAAHAYPPRAIHRCLEAGVRSIEHGNLLDDRAVELFLTHNAYLVPTLVTYWALHREGARHGLPAVSQAKVGQVLDGCLGALERAHCAGVQIAFGTDLLGGMEVHQPREFQIRAEVQQPLDIIRSATTVAASLLKMEGLIGTLNPGSYADFIVLDSDPREDISVLTRPPAMVVQGGTVVSQRSAD